MNKSFRRMRLKKIVKCRNWKPFCCYCCCCWLSICYRRLWYGRKWKLSFLRKDPFLHWRGKHLRIYQIWPEYVFHYREGVGNTRFVIRCQCPTVSCYCACLKRGHFRAGAVRRNTLPSSLYPYPSLSHYSSSYISVCYEYDIQDHA